MRILNLISFTFLFFTICISQEDTSKLTIRKDSTNEEKSQGALKVIFQGKPGKAFAYSLLVPGGGQIYNKRWWKLPIVYGAFGATIYFIDFNKSQYKRYNDAFKMRVDLGEDKSTDEFKNIYSTSALNTQRKYFDKNLQRSYLAVVAVYLLSGIEAFVDRHLMEFDVSDKLSLRWSPSFEQNNPSLKIALAFN